MTEMMIPVENINFNAELEAQVIGGILINREAYQLVKPVLNAHDFFVVRHAIIYDTFGQLHDQGIVIDYTTVSEILTRNGGMEQIGGLSYLSKLLSGVRSSFEIVYYAELVKHLSIRRAVKEVGQSTARIADDPNLTTDDILAEVETMLQRIHSRNRSQQTRSAHDIALSMLDSLARQRMGTIPTRYSRLDAMLGGGMARGNVTVIAASSGLGKTWFGLNVAANVCQAKRTDGNQFRVLYFTMEMTTDTEVSPRLLSIVSGLSEVEIRTAADSKIANDDDKTTAFMHAVEIISKWNLYVDDSTNVTPAYIKSRVAVYQPDLVIVDYLTLMDDDATWHKSDHQKYSAIIKRLKDIAKSDGNPQTQPALLVLSQLNRSGINDAYRNTRANKPKTIMDVAPELTSIKESGDIENHSAAVIMLVQTPELQEENLLGACVRKNRYGANCMTNEYRDYPPMFSRDPKTGRMKDAGRVRFILEQETKTGDPF